MECAGPKLDILSPAQGTQWKREGKECKSQRSEKFCGTLSSEHNEAIAFCTREFIQLSLPVKTKQNTSSYDWPTTNSIYMGRG